MSALPVSRVHHILTMTRGPTVERGLAALDSLYELRNLIPELMASSQLQGQEGEL